MAITRVQAAGNQANTITSITATFASGVTLGNLLVAFATNGSGTVTWTPPTGWTQINTNTGSFSPNITAFYLVVGAGQAGVTAFAFSLSGSTNAAITVTEWSSSTGWPASPVDKTAIASATTSTTVATGTTATTVQANELWTAGLDYAATAQTETGLTAGWTSGNEAAGGPTIREVYQIVSSTGAAGVSFTIGTAKNNAGSVVTFIPNPNPNPVLSTSPTNLSFSATVGGSNPASQNDTLSETAGAATAWTSAITYGSGSGWLSIAPSSGSLLASGNQVVAVSCNITGLLSGTYTATITYTATTGGATATVAVTLLISASGITTYTILLAGQDITQYADQMTVVVDDTLGQGPGAGSGGSTQGRASTLKFNTSLGPMSTAVGAGQTLPPGGPWLVRQGEVKVYDATGTLIFGGFATKYTDTSTAILGQTKQNFTTVEAIDYSTSLQRTLVNEVFTGATDVFIISYILNKYVGWVKLDYLPTTSAYTFATKNFRNQTVEQVLQTVAGITGYMVFVDYNKYVHYLSPTMASSAPFNLSSSPDFVTTFPHAVAEYLVDDNSAINRVFFYGGTKTSNDFWQDISTLANGNNLTFPLAYYPSPTTDGRYHLKTNGVDSTVATSTTAGPNGQFISQGGTATVLIDPGARAISFDTGHAPASGTSLIAGYRYSFPLSLVIADEVSHKYYGDPYLDGYIDDNTIFDLPTGIQRCKVLLAQQNYGLTSLKVDLYNKPGVQAGMVINIYNQLRGINGTYLVQEVQVEPYGGGNFVYHLSLGAWNWNLIDFLMKLPTLATFQDNTTETQESVSIIPLVNGVQVHDVWSTRTSTAPYYARAAAVGDGHDAYPGFSTAS